MKRGTLPNILGRRIYPLRAIKRPEIRDELGERPFRIIDRPYQGPCQQSERLERAQRSALVLRPHFPSRTPAARPSGAL